MQASEFYPENAEVEYRLAGLYFTMHQNEEGRFHLKNAVQLNFEYNFIITELFPKLNERAIVRAIISDSKKTPN